MIVATKSTEDLAISHEREFHDIQYAQWSVPETLDGIRAWAELNILRPTWMAGGERSEAARATHRTAMPEAGWEGVRVLDIGCGPGLHSLWIASQGAIVEGCDLSSVGVELANRAAARVGLATSARFRVADARALPYVDGSFDVVVGFGVLHHLIKYPATARELWRVLRVGGRVVAQETWWENPITNLLRHWTAYEPDAGDARLTHASLATWAGPHFRGRVEHLSIAYQVKRLLRGRFTRPGVPAILRITNAMDRLLRNVPLVRRLGAECVIELRRIS